MPLAIQSTMRTIAIAASVLLAACSFPAATQPAVSTPAPTLSPEPTPAPDIPPADTDTSPDPSLAVIGPPQVVFDWSSDSCEPEDIPDLPVRAFRDADGLVHLVSAHIRGRAFVGQSLDAVERDCRVISESGHDPDPGRFNDSEWLSSLYTEDGRTIYAVQHHEYHGWEHEGCPSEDIFTCWYNTLTLAVSTDGGRSFIDAAPPPNHFVAGLPIPYEAGAGPYGLLEASNIIKGPEGFYYLMVRADGYRSTDQWLCLLRSDDLSDPASWRAWDGDSFNMVFVDPYRQPEALREAHTCAPVGGDELGLMNTSLTYNTFLERFLMVGLSADHLDGREVWGIYYAFSDDLLNWSRRRLLWEVPLPWSYQPGDRFTILYPSLLDPDSPSLNFETTGEQNYLYFTRFNLQDGVSPLDRDLIRIPVAFFASESEAQAADARTALTLESQAGAEGRVLLQGRLSTYGGQPVAGAAIELAATGLSGPGTLSEYQLRAVSPPEAQNALIGYRVNTECDCSGEADFTIFEIGYREDSRADNLVPDPAFELGLDGLEIWGEAAVESIPAENGSGNGLRVQAEEGQVAGAHLAVVPVSPGAAFTATITARVAPRSAGSGYFVVIFTNLEGEILRLTTDLAPAPVPVGSSISDPDGNFVFEWVPEAGDFTFTARFLGSNGRWPALAESEIRIP